jgi:hypothetical protein
MFSTLMILIALIQPRVDALITCSLPCILGRNPKQLLNPVILYPISHLYAHPVLTDEDRTNESKGAHTLTSLARESG